MTTMRVVAVMACVMASILQVLFARAAETRSGEIFFYTAAVAWILCGVMIAVEGTG